MKNLPLNKKLSKKSQPLKNYLLRGKQKKYWKFNKKQSNKELHRKKNKKKKDNNK